jgi:hypothetical protein
VPGRSDSGTVQRLFHHLLVPKSLSLGLVQARHAECLAQPGCQHDAGFPQALDAIQAEAAQAIAQRGDHRLLVPQRAHRDVLMQGPAHQFGQPGQRRVTHSEYPRAGLGQAAGEFRHVRRVARGEQQYVHHRDSIAFECCGDTAQRRRKR